MRLLPSVFLTILGAIAAQGQVSSSNSSERIIVAAVFNSSLCQTDQFEIQQFVSGQCSQLGSQTVWFMCNETDPQNPMVMTRSFSSAAECASALSGGQMAGAAEGTYIDFCSPVGSDMALNFIACTDSAHLTQSIQRSTSLSVLTKDPAITFEYYAWNRPYCEGEPDDQHVIRFVYECSNYADYWGPAAPFCTDRSIVWPSYIDDQCTQVNTSVPFAVDPTGICFTAGNASFIYGTCQSSFTYSGIDSLPPARDIAELVNELTPSTSTDNFGVAPPIDPAQAVAVQQYMDAQCRTKNASEGAYSDLPLATCFASPSLPDRGIQLYCTPAGVVGLTFQDSNCSTHHRTSQLWRFENCVNSAYLDTAVAVSTCSAGTIPTSL